MLKKIDFDQGLNNINLIKTSHASQKAAAEGIVLLKNENGVLPLKSGMKISVSAGASWIITPAEPARAEALMFYMWLTY